MDVQPIYFTHAADAESATFTATVKVLDDYFVPKANISVINLLTSVI